MHFPCLHVPLPRLRSNKADIEICIGDMKQMLLSHFLSRANISQLSNQQL